VVIIKALQGANAEEYTVVPAAEKLNGRIDQAVNVQGVNVFGWAGLVHEGKMALEEQADVIGPWVIP
jgi:hypothetical protein